MVAVETWQNFLEIIRINREIPRLVFDRMVEFLEDNEMDKEMLLLVAAASVGKESVTFDEDF